MERYSRKTSTKVIEAVDPPVILGGGGSQHGRIAVENEQRHGQGIERPPFRSVQFFVHVFTSLGARGKTAALHAEEVADRTRRPSFVPDASAT